MRNPIFKILNTASGNAVNGFITSGDDVFTATAWFLRDPPAGDVAKYEWVVDPVEAVEWVDESFDWKHSFKIVSNGKMYVKAYDQNGFTLDSPSVFLRKVG